MSLALSVFPFRTSSNVERVVLLALWSRSIEDGEKRKMRNVGVIWLWQKARRNILRVLTHLQERTRRRSWQSVRPRGHLWGASSLIFFFPLLAPGLQECGRKDFTFYFTATFIDTYFKDTNVRSALSLSLLADIYNFRILTRDARVFAQELLSKCNITIFGWYNATNISISIYIVQQKKRKKKREKRRKRKEYDRNLFDKNCTGSLRMVGKKLVRHRFDSGKARIGWKAAVSRKKAPINRGGVLEFESVGGELGSKQPSDVPPFLQYDHFGGSPHFILERNLASN